MASMEMSAEYAAELRQMLHDEAAARVGEEVIAAGAFRHDPVSEELIAALRGAAPASD